MATVWTKLAFVDGDARRGEQAAALARALGLRPRLVKSTPRGPDPGRDLVRVVVQVAECSRAAIAAIKTAFPRAKVIVRGADPSQAAAIDAFRAGADDFIWLGAGDAELAGLIERHLECEPASEAVAEDGGLIGDSPAMREVREFLQRLAPTNVTTLITGESGTGKDCAALMLHRLSARTNGPLVALNCAAIPEALLEGELFGYERGAFSGALTAYPGKLKLADHGTLFLDEIGELDLAGQAKVLRVIETRQCYRLGARTPTNFDVRIIAATNRDLREEVARGRFRTDLYYRIAVAQVALPSLRDHPQDICAIARRLINDIAEAAGRRAPVLDQGAIETLEQHDWPGNVRELRNVLEVALVEASGDRIEHRHLPFGPVDRIRSVFEPRDERARLAAALDSVGGNKSLAARALKCSRMTLYRRLARCGLVEVGTVSPLQPLSPPGVTNAVTPPEMVSGKYP